MEKYDLLNLIVGIIIGLFIALGYALSIPLKKALKFLSRKPEIGVVYEFKFRLSPKHAVFYSPAEAKEFVFIVDNKDFFKDEHFYEFKKTLEFGYLGSPVVNLDWYQVAYP